MMRKEVYMMAPLLVLAVAMGYLLLAGERDAAEVRQEVVRFHVVAASDTAEDQALKLQVRDGLFARIEGLFGGCRDAQEALATAERHKEELEQAAEEILRARGKEEAVTVEVGERYFPTKSYGALAFPAGRYRAVSVRIGEAKGENFWCVLYPALCIAPAVAEERAEEELAAVIGEESTDFIKRSSQKQKIKFALVEVLENFLQNYLKI